MKNRTKNTVALRMVAAATKAVARAASWPNSKSGYNQPKVPEKLRRK